MKKEYLKEVKEGLGRTRIIKPEILTESDLNHLPAAVRKYMIYTGVVGKEKVINLRVLFDGKIRSKPDSGWMKFQAEQYSFFDDVTRIFYIRASKMGIPARGLHLYRNCKASMKIKLAGLFTISDAKGKEMNQGETVTVFNDMCVMAPALLIDKNIQWEEVDTFSVKAKYTNGDITISAVLYFNEKGQLINFISNNRYETTDGKEYRNYPWETPCKEYKDFNGTRLTSYASLIYRKPELDFCYGEFNLKEIEYNIKGLK